MYNNIRLKQKSQVQHFTYTHLNPNSDNLDNYICRLLVQLPQNKVAQQREQAAIISQSANLEQHIIYNEWIFLNRSWTITLTYTHLCTNHYALHQQNVITSIAQRYDTFTLHQAELMQSMNNNAAMAAIRTPTQIMNTSKHTSWVQYGTNTGKSSKATMDTANELLRYMYIPVDG